jgi:hypothetical protein
MGYRKQVRAERPESGGLPGNEETITADHDGTDRRPAEARG